MPRARSVKTIIAEVVMYVGMFAVVGHMSQNLYERFSLQSDLKGMKSDLNSLELIVHNIGMAYDALCEDLQELFVHKESGKPLYSEVKAPHVRPTYDSDVLHKPKHSYNRNMPEKQDEETSYDTRTITQDFMQNFNRSTNNFMQYWRAPAQDKTTFTDTLVKCINVGVNRNKDVEKDFCKCVVKCISHNDDTYKLVNLYNHNAAGLPCQVLDSSFNVQRSANDTKAEHPDNDPVCGTFQTI